MSLMQTTINAGAQYAASSSKVGAASSSKTAATPTKPALGRGDSTPKGSKENYLTNSNLRALQKKVAKLHGLNQNSRGEKIGDKGDSKRATFGENIAELELFLRRYMPWMGLIMPGASDQAKFNDHLEEMVCGRFFKKGGLLTPADWREFSGSGGKKGKSGSLVNNLWKSYMDSSVRVVDSIRMQLFNPSKHGVSCFSTTSICEGVEKGRFKANGNVKRKRILQALGCSSFDEENGILILNPDAKGQSFCLEYLQLLSAYSNGGLTKGIFFVLVILNFSFMLCPIMNPYDL